MYVCRRQSSSFKSADSHIAFDARYRDPVLMLLRLNSSDILNTCLVDISTGQTLYKVATVVQETSQSLDEDLEDGSRVDPLNISGPCFSSSFSQECTLGKVVSSTVTATVRPRPSASVTIRRTQVHNNAGKLVAEIIWRGRRPDITIGQERIQNLSKLFNTSDAKIM